MPVASAAPPGCGDIELLHTSEGDAASSGIHAERRFALTLRQDLFAFRSATAEQLSRIKALKHAMVGRARNGLFRRDRIP